MRFIIFAFFLLFCSTNIVLARTDSLPRLEAYRDWSVFRDDQASVDTCWVATMPIKSQISNPNARRGDVFLMVLVRPSSNVKNEVSFVAGYPLKEGKPAYLQIDSARFEMFTSGEGAWLRSSSEDDIVTRAMQKGSKATVKGVSTRGTKTTDIFSLMGLSKALQRARELCHG